MNFLGVSPFCFLIMKLHFPCPIPFPPSLTEVFARIIESEEREGERTEGGKGKRHGRLEKQGQNMQTELKEKHTMALLHFSIFTLQSFQISE